MRNRSVEFGACGWCRASCAIAAALALAALAGCERSGGTGDGADAADADADGDADADADTDTDGDADADGDAPPFSIEEIAGSDILSAVWVTSESDGWVGGYQFVESSYQARLFRMGSSGWSASTVPSQGSGVRRIYALPAGELYVTQSCNVYLFDGAAWLPVSEQAPQVDGHCVGIGPLWGTAPDMLWSGDSVHGDVWHFNGASWTATEVSSAGRVIDLWGSSAEDIWAVTAYQVLHRAGSGSWEVADPHPGSTEALAVWGYSSDDVWLAFEEHVAHFDGEAWTTTELPGRWYHLWGPSPGDLWAAGAEGRLAHLEGGAWTVWEFGDHISVSAVHGSADGDVWAVGARDHDDGSRTGIVLRYEP